MIASGETGWIRYYRKPLTGQSVRVWRRVDESECQVSTRFDFLFAASRESDHRPENRLVAETRSFAAVPSLGSLVPGWLLVVPKRPMLNLAYLERSEREELRGLIAALAERLRVFDGEVYAFEHGSSAFGSISGCGVDQAHLHIVPLTINLPKAAVLQRAIRWEHRSCIATEGFVDERDAEYLALYNMSSLEALIGYPERPTSQWFRKLIATEIGCSDQWDYRQHKGEKCISDTLDALVPSK
jgi:ATP adenylyltransferase